MITKDIITQSYNKEMRTELDKNVHALSSLLCVTSLLSVNEVFARVLSAVESALLDISCKDFGGGFPEFLVNLERRGVEVLSKVYGFDTSAYIFGDYEKEVFIYTATGRKKTELDAPYNNMIDQLNAYVTWLVKGCDDTAPIYNKYVNECVKSIQHPLADVEYVQRMAQLHISACTSELSLLGYEPSAHLVADALIVVALQRVDEIERAKADKQMQKASARQSKFDKFKMNKENFKANK